MDNKGKVPYYNTFRSLDVPLYLIRLFGLRLTSPDIGICLLLLGGCMTVLDITGFKHRDLFYLPLEPWGWLLPPLLLAIAISILHKLKPEGKVEVVLLGLFYPKRYSATPLKPDKYWFPSSHLINPVRSNKHHE